MTFRIESRIGVAAPASVIWGALADLPRWADWNPLYTAASGTLRIGETLTLRLALQGEKPETIRAVVEDWVPDAQILWRTRFAAGLVHTLRYIEIEELTDTGCIVGAGEVFEGVGARFMPARLRGRIREGNAAMAAALKARAESVWRSEAGAPTSPA